MVWPISPTQGLHSKRPVTLKVALQCRTIRWPHPGTANILNTVMLSFKGTRRMFMLAIDAAGSVQFPFAILTIRLKDRDVVSELAVEIFRQYHLLLASAIHHPATGGISLHPSEDHEGLCSPVRLVDILVRPVVFLNALSASRLPFSRPQGYRFKSNQPFSKNPFARLIGKQTQSYTRRSQAVSGIGIPLGIGASSRRCANSPW